MEQRVRRRRDSYGRQSVRSCESSSVLIFLSPPSLFKADLLVLSTSEASGICFIETKELDGETNLKNRSALTETAAMGDNPAKISEFNGTGALKAIRRV